MTNWHQTKRPLIRREAHNISHICAETLHFYIRNLIF